MEFGGSWFVVRGSWSSFFMYLQYYSTETFWKFFPKISLTLSPADFFKNASKKNSPQTDCQRDGARKR